MQLSLAIHSSPRFSTWVWFNDWKLLIDAGDGASQQLGYKIRKLDTVLLTHSHRDHIGGLLQVINQRGEAGPFTLGHPANGRSYSDIEVFSRKFNPGTSHQAVWRALEEGDWIETGIEGRLVKSFRTRHFLKDNPQQAPRSLGFQLYWRKNKVKPEFAELTQKELDAKRMELGRALVEASGEKFADERAQTQATVFAGREAITSPVDEKWVTISGDTQPINPEIARGSQLLLHEATFLQPDDYDSEAAGEDVGHMHSTVFDAVKIAREAQVPNLVLYHISTRYSDNEIREAIALAGRELGYDGKIWAAMPRRVHWDLLSEKPVY